MLKRNVVKFLPFHNGREREREKMNSDEDEKRIYYQSSYIS